MKKKKNTSSKSGERLNTLELVKEMTEFKLDVAIEYLSNSDRFEPTFENVIKVATLMTNIKMWEHSSYKKQKYGLEKDIEEGFDI